MISSILLIALALPANELAGAVKADKAKLAPAARKQLEKQGSVVVEGSERHFYALYDRNAYLGIPSYLTTDVLLHTFHVKLDELLRRAEREQALKDLEAFATEQMTRALEQKQLDAASYHAVPVALLSAKATIDPRIKTNVEAEVARIRAATKIEPTPLCSLPIDYTQMKPRGPYSRNPDYFRAFSFYAHCAFELTKPEGLARAKTLAALADKPAREKLARLQSLIELVAGKADDPGLEAIDKITGTDLSALPKPKVAPQKLVFRMLGTAGTPDSILFTQNATLERPLPSGLDLFAALGSKEANSLLAKPIDRRGLELGPSLYDEWLAILGKIAAGPQPDAPKHAKTPAWSRRLLISALGSWTELRHDTILYTKQPLVMMQGGHSDELPATKWAGYVEPDLTTYRALQKLLARVEAALGGTKNEALHSLIDFAIRVSELELANKPFPKEVDDRLRGIGTELEHLARGNADELPDMALATDVFTAVFPDEEAPRILHAAIGDVDELWVVVQRGKQKLLARGGVFSYYEFVEASRIDDGEWIDRLRGRNKPSRPTWAEPHKSAPKTKN